MTNSTDRRQTEPIDVFVRRVAQTEKSESTQNKPISSTHAKPVKAMVDMNKARNEKAIYG